MAQFKVPASPAKSIFQMNYFQGCDFTNSPASVDETKSPNCVNMIRDVPGKVRKSMGYKKVAKYPGKVNGAHYLRRTEEQLIHAGDKIYYFIEDANDSILLYEGANDERSKAWQIGDGLYIQDGKELLVYKREINDDGYDHGVNTKEVKGKRFSVDIKVVEEKTVHFIFPYKIEKVEITGDEYDYTKTFTPAVEKWNWTSPSNGNFAFIFTAEDVIEAETFNASPAIMDLKNGTSVFFESSDSEHPLYEINAEKGGGTWSGKTYTSNEDGSQTFSWSNSNYKDVVRKGQSRNFKKGSVGWFTCDYEDFSDAFVVCSGGGLENGFTASIVRPDSLYIPKYKLSNDNGISLDFKYSALIDGQYQREYVSYGYGTTAKKTFILDFDSDYPRSKTMENAQLEIITSGGIKSFSGEIHYLDSLGTEYINVISGQQEYPYERNLTIPLKLTRGYSFKLIDLEVEIINSNNIARNTSDVVFVGLSRVYENISYSFLAVPINLDYTDEAPLIAHRYDTETLSGILTYEVDVERRTDGFIDGTKGDYVDSDGYNRTITRVMDEAYIPTLTIAKPPSGGGETYEPLNLIQPAFIETFQPSEVDPERGQIFPTAFHMSFDHLDNTPPIVKLLNKSGGWDVKTEGTHYTVDREKGIINFKTAPGASPIEGEDSVWVQAYKTFDGYADRINKCTISALFGVNGSTDRLFVSGNPDFINYDWYSDLNNPTYFPDVNYSVLGTGSSAIIGYSIISNYLAAYKDDRERDSNIILREGNLMEDKAAFPVVATLQGAGAVAPWSFAYLETEPMFLTNSGIYAVTAQDITGEKYAQNRSFYLDGKLLEEENLKDAYACVYNDFYVMALNGKLYILDGLQPLRADKSMPYATRSYAGFYRENVPATAIWNFNNSLYFGTKDGTVFKFYKDKYALESYNDNGEAISCCWETPDIDGKLFFKNKTFRYLAVKLDSALATSINIFTMKRGIWNLAKKDNSTARYFSFPHIDFSKFSFSTDTTQRVLHTKIRLKKVDKARFRFANDELNEPFCIYDIALEYVERGNYKG